MLGTPQISPDAHGSLENGSIMSTFIIGFKTYKHVTKRPCHEFLIIHHGDK
jgi:hypothetical protein